MTLYLYKDDELYSEIIVAFTSSVKWINTVAFALNFACLKVLWLSHFSQFFIDTLYLYTQLIGTFVKVLSSTESIVTNQLL